MAATQERTKLFAPPRPASGESRIGYVDGLRAVAVPGVLFFHVWQDYPSALGHGPVADVLGAVLKMGAHGVDLFFVLSGYCLAYPTLHALQRNEGTRFDLISFWAKRLVRIVPPFWIAIILAVAIVGPLGIAVGRALAPEQLLAQALFLDKDVWFVNGSFWTLSIEMRWYAVFPFALWLYAVSPRTFAAATASVFLASNLTRAGGVDFGTLPLFLAGIWVADIRLRNRRFGGYALAIGLPTALIATLLEPPLGKQFYAIEPIGMVATVALVIAAGDLAPVRALLGSRILTAIGIASYSMYLVNDPVVHAGAHFGLPPLETGTLAFGASLAFYAFAERPFANGPLRKALVDRVRTWLESSARFLRAPRTIAIGTEAADGRADGLYPGSADDESGSIARTPQTTSKR